MDRRNILARKLRKNQTPQELKLWKILRNQQFYGLKFRRQYPIGNYIVDFICKEEKIIIELDGGQHNSLGNIEKDKIRTEFLKIKGYKVIRFWNDEVDKNLEGVFNKLKEIIIDEPSP